MKKKQTEKEIEEKWDKEYCKKEGHINGFIPFKKDVCPYCKIDKYLEVKR